MSLLVVGTLAFDTVETAHDRREDALGGSAVYFSISAAHFAPVTLVGVVGTDFGRERLADLERRGIDTSGVQVSPGQTFRWSGRYEADWNTRHTLATHLNVFEAFEPRVPEAHRDSPFVFLANAAPEIQLEALSQCRAPEFVVADTMNYWITSTRKDLDELLRRVHGIVLNDEEARMLSGKSNLIQAAQDVRKMGPRYVLLKKGEHGAFLIGDDVRFALPAYPVAEVVDPTGAGDAFAGGFMGYVASTQSLEPRTLRRAMVYGTVTASFCVQGFSIEDLGRRKRSEIESRFNELIELVAF